jgi:23S rRNA (cytosine1962-C5)-methyltransferase
VKNQPSGLIRHEDEHLLVVNKPAGMNTHAPSPYAGEGIYEWLRHREPRWASLAIIHRLDKETSGLVVFSKTQVANRSLTAQFTERRVKKTYTLLVNQPVRKDEFGVKSTLVRAGERYVSRPAHGGGAAAETRFRVVRRDGELTLLQAEPITGRTHQIRVHAADAGIPIVGDALYGWRHKGDHVAHSLSRLCLHAEKLEFEHPMSGERMRFEAQPDFAGDSRRALRAAIVDSAETNAWREIHGASDSWPGWYVERLGDYVLSQSESELSERQREFLRGLDARGVYHKRLLRQLRKRNVAEVSPRLVLGEAAPERFAVQENGLRYELRFGEGYSVGLFLDQRDNRRRLLKNHVGAGFPLHEGGPGGREVLNVFAYTCGFSVCAANARAQVTSLDLSRKYLDWGRRNFELNGLDPAAHDFIYGDAFDWLRRLAKKGRAYDVILLDPPTFSQSKEHGLFRAEKDYGKLVESALPLLKANGVLFSSTNAAEWAPEAFVQTVHKAIRSHGRRVLQEHYAPQPPDFQITRQEPAYLKTLWVRVSPSMDSSTKRR